MTCKAVGFTQDVFPAAQPYCCDVRCKGGDVSAYVGLGHQILQ